MCRDAVKRLVVGDQHVDGYSNADGKVIEKPFLRHEATSTDHFVRVSVRPPKQFRRTPIAPRSDS